LAKAKILVVDDDPAVRTILSKRLKAVGYEVHLGADGREGLHQARRIIPDIIICDWMMPVMDGLEMLREVKEDEDLRSCYFILLTARGELESKVDALERGADEYLVKPVHERELLARVKAALRIADYQKKLSRLATTDALTGLVNRRKFEELLREETTRAHRYKRPLSLLVIDVNDFKKVNDRYGHARGDRILQGVAEMIRAGVRTTDIPARIGGDEFAVILPEIDSSSAATVAGRLRAAAASDEKLWEGLDFQGSISIGSATIDESNRLDPEELMRIADARMYEDKHSQRGSSSKR